MKKRREKEWGMGKIQRKMEGANIDEKSATFFVVKISVLKKKDGKNSSQENLKKKNV